MELYKANKKLCAIIELGQGKSHGMAMLGKTKCDDYPNGLAWEFVVKAKKANKPSDASIIMRWFGGCQNHANALLLENWVSIPQP